MELSTRYDPQATEKKWYATWCSAGYFHADETSAKLPYSVVIPPPNVTGILHMGHALNNTLQDALIRWKRMAGFNAMWLPGTDHAGIATQNVVERALLKEGLSRHDLGREKFIERVWQWKEKHGNIIIDQLKRIGSSCDWERERFTMDAGLSRSVRTVFKRLYDEGLIYKGNYLINWCPRCLTTLADDEVEYADKAGKLYYMRYPLVNDPTSFAVVATTRPETMLGDTAVAVNPSDERYKNWIGQNVRLPLTDRVIPIIADDFVDKEFGTGMVKITPAHDPNDYMAGKRHGLEEINILTPDAHINEASPTYAGLDRYVARKRIIQDLESQGLIEKIDEHPQRVGHCYRCHTAIEPYISLQWFVKMRPLAEPARKAVEDGRVRFIPKQRERDYYHWLDNVRDWPISRQLWWGHRIPAWYCSCGHTIVSDADLGPTECPKCGGTDLTQDPDVLDTWFSSALWPFSTLGWPEQTDELKAFYPTATLVTAKDIIFFWVARMIMMGLHFMKEVPFKQVYFNPIVGDEHGKKMSKSKGNAIDPIGLLEEYGADALRMTMCDYATQDQFIAFSVKRCEGYRNFMNKLWNAARLIFANTEDLSSADLAGALPLLGREPRLKLALEDRWIASRFGRTIRRVNSALESFEFDTAVKTIYDFVWKDFCDYYLELAKRRIYQKDASSDKDRVNAQGTLVSILEGSLRLLHPFSPFITEELWSAVREKWGADQPAKPEHTKSSVTLDEPPSLGAQTLDALRSPSIMVAPWNDFAPEALIDDEAENEFELLREVVYTIRNIRGEMKIPPSVPATVHLVAQTDDVCKLLEEQSAFLTSLTNIKTLEVLTEAEAPAFAATGVAGPVVVYVELPEELRKQEIERLQKELTRIAGERERLDAKLSNEAFAGKAPAQVVAKEREKLDKLVQEQDQLESKLGALQKA